MTVAESVPRAILESTEEEFNPLASAEARFDEAAARLGLDEGMQKCCGRPRAR